MKMLSITRCLVFAQCVLLSAACGGAPRENPWPSADRVKELTQVTHPKKTETKIYGDTGEWAMVNTPAVAGSIPLRPVTALEKLLEAEASQRPHLVPTESLTCLAQELARFAVQHGTPRRPVLRFISRRCGVVQPSVGYNFVVVPVGTHDENITSDSLTKVQDTLNQMISTTNPTEIGIGVFTNERRAYVAIPYAQKKVDIQPVNMHIDGETAVIEGTSLLGDVGYMWGSVNQGTHGYESCEQDARVILPAFRFTCRILPEDTYAAIIISQKKKDAYLGEDAVTLSVASNRAPDSVYRSPRIRHELLARASTQQFEVEGVAEPESDRPPTQPRPVVDLPERIRLNPLPQIGRRAETYETDFVTLLNAVRGGQDLPPVRLEKNQSATIATLAPLYFDSDDPKLKDELAMAISAGWDINEPIVNGSFWGQIFASSDPIEHLDSIMDEPDGRALLLNPTLSTLAIGGSVAKTSPLIIGTYHYAPKESMQRHIGHVLRLINHERQQLGLPPAKESSKTRTFATTVASRIASNEVEVDAGARELMYHMVAKHDSGVRVHWMRVNNLKEFQLPRTVLTRKDLTVSISVALRQDPGFPWYDYVVIISFLN